MVVWIRILVVMDAITHSFGEVQTVNVSPSVLVVGQSITFSGVVSGTTVGDQIAVYVFAGSNCPAGTSIAPRRTLWRTLLTRWRVRTWDNATLPSPFRSPLLVVGLWPRNTSTRSPRDHIVSAYTTSPRPPAYGKGFPLLQRK